MTPKDKARLLVTLMSVRTDKQRALTVVDEVISALTEYGEDSNELQNMDSELRWWDEVREEIRK